jgi:hypothetical protein
MLILSGSLQNRSRSKQADASGRPSDPFGSRGTLRGTSPRPLSIGGGALPLGRLSRIVGNAVGALNAIRCEVGHLACVPLVQVRRLLLQDSRTVVCLGSVAVYLGGAPLPA